MTDDPILIVEYDASWAEAFRMEQEVIVDAIGTYIHSFEHIGSTAVVGLAAKPVIDMMIGLHSLTDAVHCFTPLAELAYEYVPEFESELPERRYFRKFTGALRTHHIHMVEYGTEFWKRHLAFRDHLRSHSDTAGEYAALKKRLAQEFRTDRVGYTDAKTEFITRIESAVKSES